MNRLFHPNWLKLLMKFLVLFCFLGVGSVLFSANAQDRTRILFIGNSYTGQIRGVIQKLILASPQGGSTELEFITPGGKTLEYHLQNESTIRRIKEGDWDFVVLQDQSQTPAIFPKKFESAAEGLDAVIDASGAQTVFYQTWGRRDGDKMNPNMFPDYKSMQKALSENYSRVAKRCDATLSPVGDAWAKVRKADPDLGRALYKGDGSHPSEKGAYLAACVFYATIFQQSPASVDFRGGLDSAEVESILKAIDVPAQLVSKKSVFPVSRTITNATGVRIDVNIVGRSETSIYFTARGRNHIYQIDQLSQEDQDFVETLPLNK